MQFACFVATFFMPGTANSGRYFEHVRDWYLEYLNHPERILLLRYEDLIADLNTYVRRIAAFIGVTDERAIAIAVERRFVRDIRCICLRLCTFVRCR